MQGLQPLLVVLLAIGIIAGLVWRYVQGARRRAALQSYCASQGWQYAAEDSSLTYRWAGTPFGTGDRRRARNVISGTHRGAPFVAFDYQYDTESSDGRGNRNRTTHHFDVVALALPTALPALQVTPHGAFGRAAESLGLGAGIELESEDFDRRFAVHAKDPKFASDVLTPRTMQALLAAAPAAWRFQGTDVVSWGSGTLQPVDVLSRLATLHTVIAGIPSFVWHDNGLTEQATVPAPGNPAGPSSASANGAPTADTAGQSLFGSMAATARAVSGAAVPPGSATTTAVPAGAPPNGADPNRGAGGGAVPYFADPITHDPGASPFQQTRASEGGRR